MIRQYPPGVDTPGEKHIYDMGWTDGFLLLNDIWEEYKRIAGSAEKVVKSFDDFMAISEVRAKGGSTSDMYAVAELRGSTQLMQILEDYKHVL